MAMVDVASFRFPAHSRRTTGPSFAGQTLDATGEYLALIFRAPKAGNLRKFAARVGTITVAPVNGARFSFQTIASTGLPDGAVDQFATIPAISLVTNSWNDPGNFDADRAVTVGEVVCAVIDFASFVATDNFQLSTLSSINCVAHAYQVLNGVKSATNAPCFAIMYDDSTWANLGDDYVLPANSVNTRNFALDNATADEYGLTFTPAVGMRCSGMELMTSLTAAGTAQLLLYEGTTVRRTTTIDTDFAVTGSTGYAEFRWDDGTYDLAANTVYTVAIRPTTNGVTVAISDVGLPSEAIVNGTLPGGNTVYLSRRLNQGAWTHFNNVTDGFNRPFISAIIDGIDSGGGMIVHPGMSGRCSA